MAKVKVAVTLDNQTLRHGMWTGSSRGKRWWAPTQNMLGRGAGPSFRRASGGEPGVDVQGRGHAEA